MGRYLVKAYGKRADYAAIPKGSTKSDINKMRKDISCFKGAKVVTAKNPVAAVNKCLESRGFQIKNVKKLR